MRAIISGAGIAGLASALSLRKAGWEVGLIERAPALRTGGYMIDFFGPGFDAAARLGVLPALERRSHQVSAIDWVGPDGKVNAKLDYGQMQRAADGKLFPLLRGDVEEALHEALPREIAIRFGTHVTSTEQDDEGVTVRLSTGEAERCDLLVGAGGIHSGVRRLMFGPEEKYLRPLGLKTAAYLFESEEVAARLAGRFAMLNVPGRMVGFYEAGQNRLASFFVWHDESLDLDGDPAAVLRETFGDLGWEVPAALAAIPPAHEIYLDVVAQVDMPRWHKGRVVLVGDAAYAVSLVAGQGASLALAGGAALGEALADGATIASALETMEARLRPEVLKKQKTGRNMADWFAPRRQWQIGLRDFAFNVLNTPVFAGLLGPLFALDSKGFSARA